MRYFWLFLYTTLIWMLIAAAAAAQKALLAVQKGSAPGGTSVLPGLVPAGILTGTAYGCDRWFPPCGTLSIVLLHAAVGLLAGAYIIYAIAMLRRSRPARADSLRANGAGSRPSGGNGEHSRNDP